MTSFISALCISTIQADVMMIIWENVVVPWEANHPQASELTGERRKGKNEGKRTLNS
jgi:hypothetical protein